ncbi:MAG: tetratricopeptide repeat protein [bacterium]
MDRLDILSIGLIILLSALITGMVALHQEPLPVAGSAQPQQAKSVDQNLYGEVERLIKSAQYEEALKVLKNIMNRYPQKPESQVFLAAIYNQQGDMEKAISLCRTSIENNPDLVELASANLKDMVQKNIPKLKRARELKPNDAQVANLLQNLYFCQRKLGQGCE